VKNFWLGLDPVEKVIFGFLLFFALYMTGQVIRWVV